MFLVKGVDVAVALSFILMYSLRAVRGGLCGSTPRCLVVTVWLLKSEYSKLLLAPFVLAATIAIDIAILNCSD